MKLGSTAQRPARDCSLDSDPATVTITVTFVDTDEDTVADTVDNCPTVANTDQTDTDTDGIGDACDEDKDGDGVPAAIDCNDLNAAVSENATFYADNDADGFGDPESSIEVCALTPPDGYVDDNTDNCPEVANADQADTDGDGLGDACDDDSDGDGILDDGDHSGDPNDNPCENGQTEGCDDNCRFTVNPDQVDTDSNGEGDACTDDANGDHVLDAVDQCPLVPGVPEQNGCPYPIEYAGGSACTCNSATPLASSDVAQGLGLVLLLTLAYRFGWRRRRQGGSAH